MNFINADICLKIMLTHGISFFLIDKRLNEISTKTLINFFCLVLAKKRIITWDRSVYALENVSEKLFKLNYCLCGLKTEK